MPTTFSFAFVRRFWWVPVVLIAAPAALVLLWWHWPRQVPPTASLPARTTGFAASRPVDTRLRGVNWVGADSVASSNLEPLVRSGVTWIAQTPFGWQAGVATPEVRLHTGATYRGYWGESDRGLAHTTKLARQRGIRTMLKPHLWVRGSSSWPGDINMATAADWQAWFASYSVFLLHYAQLAESNHMDALCIGTELQHATVGHEAAWRDLIKQVRGVYHGPLTYAANWSGEFEQVRFWDALDYIGIQAYFPLSTTTHPTKATLLASWQQPLRRIEAVQKRYKKPVLFTEIGYKTTPDAAIEPWAWPDRTAVFAELDEQTQRTCYEAMFETFWGRPWFQGTFIWKWYPGLQPDGPAHRHLDFTPQHKPAEQVMAHWYGK